MRRCAMILAIACAATRVDAQAIDLSRYRIVDLTHPFNAQTLYWPNAPSTFKL